MRTIKVTLDGQEVEVRELRSRQNAAWRQRLLEGPLAELTAALEAAPNVDLTDGQALAGLVRSVSGVVLGSVDTMAEMVAAYDEKLAEVVPKAYDSEIVEAFTAVLGLAYPFGVLLQKLKVAGLQLRQT